MAGRPSHQRRTAKQRKAVLAAIARGLTVSEAARAAGLERSTVFRWRADDTAFARDYQDAFDAGTDIYEAAARRRAFKGMSDALLIFLLKQRQPERFNQKMVEVRVEVAPVLINGDGSNDADEVVHFYLPDNHRQDPLPIETVPVIEAVAAVVPLQVVGGTEVKVLDGTALPEEVEGEEIVWEKASSRR
jgi:hypothetical protein